MRRRWPWARVVGAWALLLPGVVAFQPVFGDARGLVPGLVGVTLGTLIVALGGWLRATPLTWALAGIVGYYLVGGPIAAPETLKGGWPTLDTVARLSQLTYQGFADLLTVAAPAGDLPGPHAVPLLLGLLSSLVLIGVVYSTRAVALPMLVPVLWLAVAIAFGIKQAPHALGLGLVLGAGILVWGAAHRIRAVGLANSTFLVARPTGMSRRTWQALSAAAVIALGCGAAFAVEALVTNPPERRVLRDLVAPPLDLSDYPSPLVKYRYYSLNQAEETLFTVSGRPAASRLRLAVMDVWNGEVFNVSTASGRFLRVGRELPWQPKGQQVTTSVTAAAYDDVWIPSFGQPGHIEFSGEQAEAQNRGLYVNESSYQSLTTPRFGEGSTVVVSAEPMQEVSAATREQLGDVAPQQVPPAERIPEVLTQLAANWTTGAANDYQALSAIAEQLRTIGYYSNGAEENSRAGHNAERLAYMFNQEQWIGDDEQYAAAMSLMATSQGIPTRVVLGFYPSAEQAANLGEVWQVTGADAHVWVEAYFEGAGWVSFDPTPNREPNLDNPDPKPKPKPRVDPPPAPPEHLEPDTVTAEEESVELDEDEEASRGAHPLLVVLLWSLGVGALLALPFGLIAALKAIRMKRRRTASDPTTQVIGAWDELVDRARDMGYVPKADQTRRESALDLERQHQGVAVYPLAGQVDRYVYGHEEPDPSEREGIWTAAVSLKRSLLGTRPWYARPVAIFSWRSLRRAWKPARKPGLLWKAIDRATGQRRSR